MIMPGCGCYGEWEDAQAHRHEHWVQAGTHYRVQDPGEKYKILRKKSSRCGSKLQELLETFPASFPLNVLVGSWQGRFQMVIVRPQDAANLVKCKPITKHPDRDHITSDHVMPELQGLVVSTTRSVLS